MIVLDTNVVSELMSPSPSPQITGWARTLDRQELRTTTITVAEIKYGIARLPDGRRKQALATAAGEVFSAFDGQVLPIDTAAAEQYAVIVSSRDSAGKPIQGFDALIAAVCRAQDATLATRNVPDFTDCGIKVMNPWAG